jgi:hypothetical protein
VTSIPHRSEPDSVNTHMYIYIYVCIYMYMHTSIIKRSTLLKQTSRRLLSLCKHPFPHSAQLRITAGELTRITAGELTRWS